MSNLSPNIRLVRAPDPLGLYVRVAGVGQKDLQTFLASRSATFNGVVFEARRVEPRQESGDATASRQPRTSQKELLSLVLEKRMDAVLDPQTQAMATPGGYTAKMNHLPWSLGRMHRLEDYTPELIHTMADDIAKFAVAHSFTQVLAPTHLIRDAFDPWLPIDIACARALRLALRRRNGASIQMNYSLAMPYSTFRTKDKRDNVIERLRAIEFDSLWLNIDGSGSDMSPSGVVRYNDAATAFHGLGVPIVADHMGGLVGLSLLAFGSVGGLSHGITMFERWDARSWLKPNPDSTPFGPKVRIYLPSIDLLLAKDEAEKLFESGAKAKSHYGCRDTNCCARGILDTLQGPVRHFLHQRTEEVAGLGRIPESLRAGRFLEEHLRPATDRAILGPTLPVSDKLREKLAKHSKRLNDLRIVLGGYNESQRAASYSRHPKTRAARETRRRLNYE
jgi:hypothetical protein